jgi:hypothetical protein
MSAANKKSRTKSSDPTAIVLADGSVIKISPEDRASFSLLVSSLCRVNGVKKEEKKVSKITKPKIKAEKIKVPKKKKKEPVSED